MWYWAAVTVHVYIFFNTPELCMDNQETSDVPGFIFLMLLSVKQIHDK